MVTAGSFPFRAIQASVLVTVLRREQGLGHADLHLFIIWTFCVINSAFILQPNSLHGIHHWLAMCSCLWPLQVVIDYRWYHMVWHKQYFLFSNISVITSVMRWSWATSFFCFFFSVGSLMNNIFTLFQNLVSGLAWYCLHRQLPSKVLSLLKWQHSHEYSYAFLAHIHLPKETFQINK